MILSRHSGWLLHVWHTKFKFTERRCSKEVTKSFLSSLHGKSPCSSVFSFFYRTLFPQRRETLGFLISSFLILKHSDMWWVRAILNLVSHPETLLQAATLILFLLVLAYDCLHIVLNSRCWMVFHLSPCLLWQTRSAFTLAFNFGHFLAIKTTCVWNDPDENLESEPKLKNCRSQNQKNDF